MLQNPVPVRALFDKEAALEVTLRNLLNRKGYHDLDAVRAEGHKEGHTTGKAEAVLQIFAARGLLPTDAERAQILGSRDSAALDRLIQRALQAKTVGEALG